MAYFLALGAKPAGSFVLPARLNMSQHANPPPSAASFMVHPPAAASAPPAAATVTSAKAGAKERQYTVEQVRNAARRILCPVEDIGVGWRGGSRHLAGWPA